MRIGTRSGFVAGVFAMLLAGAAFAQPVEREIDVPPVDNPPGENEREAPDWVGDLATPEDVERHARKATEWLRRHPRHDYAVHVAERLYLLGRAQDDFSRLDPMREFFIAQHPRAIFTQFVAKDYGAAVNNGPDRSLPGYVRRRVFPVVAPTAGNGAVPWYAGGRPAADRFDPDRLAPVLMVVEQGLKQPDLANSLNAPDLLLSLHLARSLSPNTPLRTYLRKSVSSLSAPGPELASILDDAERSAVERILEIERLRAKAVAGPCNLYQEYLSTRLTEDELDSPGILAIRVERALETWNFREALSSLERLDREAPTTRRRFLRAWGMYHVGRDADAKQELTKLAASSSPSVAQEGRPKTATPVTSSRTTSVSTDGWRRLAGESLSELDRQPELREEFVKTLSVPLDQLRQNTIAPLLLTIVTRPPKKPGHTIHVLYSASHRQMTVTVHSEGKCVVGYRSSTRDAQVYLGGDATVATWNSPGQFPTATLVFGWSASGATSNVNWQVCAEPLKLATDLTAILAQPMLSNAEMFSRLNGAYLAGGLLSPPGDAADGSRTWTITYPKLRAPEWDRREWTVSATGDELSYVGPNVTVSLQQKPDELPPELTDWTKLPVAEAPVNDIQHSMRMMSVMMEVMGELMGVMENAEVAIEEGEVLRK